MTTIKDLEVCFKELKTDMNSISIDLENLTEKVEDIDKRVYAQEETLERMGIDLGHTIMTVRDIVARSGK
jgi:uncharacterized coiled-coil protein SlyX